MALTGNDAVAEALRQVNPDVAAIYPITPQTEMMMKFAQYYADGKVDTEVVCVESEHSAMSATVGAAAAGARAITATSSAGMALMWEILYVAASNRLPIVMALVNRALSAPINIHCDHSDGMGARDTGWLQIYSESAQEAYDNTIQAFRIAEHPDVLTPAMVTLDGFILSHTMEVIDILPDEEVKKFVGEYKPENYLLNTEHPLTMGPLDLPPHYFEHKRQQVEGLDNSLDVIRQVAREYKEMTGREYDLLELYKMEDAEIAVMALGSSAGTAKEAVDTMRDKGVKAGLIKVRVFRPFPVVAILEATSNLKALGVMDRAIAFGAQGGAVFLETRSALYERSHPPVLSYIYGLGGRDVTIEHIAGVFEELAEVAKTGKVKQLVNYVNLREPE
ncbi:MAG: pyruvate ferredoxin oxidoreductase [Planctomycetota bacterium]|nr:MAG: pyruvate ferredoxin oxidoreductase [Planctomycetota bacterium]